MINFGGNSQNNSKSNSGLKPGNNQQANTSKDVATAEYSYFYIHQIKAWSNWSVDQEEVDYIIDPPVYLNA